MKKIISALLVCVLLVGCVLALASCGKMISGTYKDPTGNVQYKFSGNKVTKTTDKLIGDDEVIEGKYSITEADDGSMTITFEFEGQTAETVGFAQGEENGVKYIKLGTGILAIKYTEVK